MESPRYSNTLEGLARSGYQPQPSESATGYEGGGGRGYESGRDWETGRERWDRGGERWERGGGGEQLRYSAGLHIQEPIQQRREEFVTGPGSEFRRGEGYYAWKEAPREERYEVIREQPIRREKVEHVVRERPVVEHERVVVHERPIIRHEKSTQLQQEQPEHQFDRSLEQSLPAPEPLHREKVVHVLREVPIIEHERVIVHEKPLIRHERVTEIVREPPIERQAEFGPRPEGQFRYRETTGFPEREEARFERMERFAPVRTIRDEEYARSQNLPPSSYTGASGGVVTAPPSMSRDSGSFYRESGAVSSREPFRPSDYSQASAAEPKKSKVGGGMLSDIKAALTGHRTSTPQSTPPGVTSTTTSTQRY